MEQKLHPLTDWVIQRIQAEYRDDIALLIGIEGHNTNGDEHGVCFDYFVPATERGNALAETFVIDGVGHDLYPRSWERLEQSVQLEDMAIVIDGAVILYARSREDEERFLQLKERLHGNLQNAAFVYGKALSCMDKALQVYQSLIFEEKKYRIRSEANYMHLWLSKAVAFLNHTYTESALYSRKQAYDDTRERRIYHCPELQAVPDRFFEEAEQLLAAQEVSQIRQSCFSLLKATRGFILERKPKRQMEPASEADYAGLAEWYQELSLTWRRIRYFCAQQMVEEAYIDAGYLQEELLYIAQEYQVEELALLDAFDRNDLSLLAKRSIQIEKVVQDILAEHKIPLQTYESVEAFLTQRQGKAEA